MVSVTLDSNVYISALNYGGPPLRLLNLAREGMIRLDVSDAILEEFAGVLRDKFRWSDEDIADAQHEIMWDCIKVGGGHNAASASQESAG